MSNYKLIDKITNLNKAYKEIGSGIKILEKLYKSNPDVSYYLYKLKKIYGQLNKKLLKLIQQEQMDEDFDKLIITLKKENYNE